MNKELTPLGALERIKIGSCKGKYKDYCDIIETALKESEKDDEIKQAFKIFLKKQVEINILFATFNLKNGFYIYNKSAIRKLTQKEYNFLKKVLK